MVQEVSGFTVAMVYLLAWWLVFFLALPFGVKRSEDPEAGHSTGAPVKPYLGHKALAATVIAAFLTWGFFAFIEAGFIPIRDAMH